MGGFALLSIGCEVFVVLVVEKDQDGGCFSGTGLLQHHPADSL
jgi:hypothetical protein